MGDKKQFSGRPPVGDCGKDKIGQGPGGFVSMRAIVCLSNEIGTFGSGMEKQGGLEPPFCTNPSAEYIQKRDLFNF